MVGNLRRYVGSGLVPAIYPEFARTANGKFAPGVYAQGQVLGKSLANVAASSVQTVVANGTSGNFVIQYNGYLGVGQTPSMAYNVNITLFQTNLNLALVQALGSNANQGVTVSGNAGNYTCTFGNALANLPQAPLISPSGNLSGGGANVTVTQTTLGVSAGGYVAAYAAANTDGTKNARYLGQYDLTVDGMGNHYYGGGEWGESHTSAPYYTLGAFYTSEMVGLDAAGAANLGRFIDGDSGNLTAPQTVLDLAGGVN